MTCMKHVFVVCMHFLVLYNVHIAHTHKEYCILRRYSTCACTTDNRHEALIPRGYMHDEYQI